MFHSCLLACAFAVCIASAAQAQSLTSRLGTMTEEQVFDGCSCTFAAKGGRGRLAKGYVFSSGIAADRPEALVVLDGAKMSLRQVGSAARDTPMKRGSRQRSLFASEDGTLRVGIETTIVRDCTGQGESCEAVEEEGTMSLSLGAGTPEKLPIKGVCGC